MSAGSSSLEVAPPQDRHVEPVAPANPRSAERAAQYSEAFRVAPLSLLVLFQSCVVLPPQAASEQLRTLLLGLAGGISLLLWLFSAPPGRSKPGTQLGDPTCLLALGYLAWTALSAVGSTLPALAAYETYRQAAGGALLLGIGFGLSGPGGLLLSRSLVMALLAMIVVWLERYLTAGGAPGGAFVDEQLFAAVLSGLLSVALAHARHDPHRLLRAASWLAVLGGLPVLFATQNRSAWLATLLAGSLWIYVDRPRGVRLPATKRRSHLTSTWITGLVLLAAVVMLNPNVGQRLRTLQTFGGEPTYLWRQEMWRLAGDMAAERPFTGWGPGSFAVQQARFDPAARSQRDVMANGASLTENAHNSYLQLAAEIGWPGALLFGLVPLSLAGRAVRDAWRASPQRRRPFLHGSAAAAVAMAVSALGNPAWQFSQCSTLFWIVLGLGVLFARAPAGVLDGPLADRVGT